MPCPAGKFQLLKMTNLRLSDQCEELQSAIVDKAVTLVYGQASRRYAVIVANRFQILPNLGHPLEVGLLQVNDAINFYPWSGKPLPGCLFNERIKVIKDQLGIEYSVSIDETLFPPELVTEEWWLRRKFGPTNAVLREDWVKPRPVDNHILVRAIDPLLGFKRFGELSPHMCQTMSDKLNDIRVMIAYLPHTREYGFRVIEPSEPIDNQSIKVRSFRYCPWCGDALPENLRIEWETRVLAQGFTLDAMDYPATPPSGFPAALASDAWWLAEGL